ncbi:hypothetical protein SDC9_146957 [bioreactor metagenome]|uniref:Uncharacterized protein n=1 Tax=bioreactor metagenome TaxID=1076179 RepID=A0A645EG78_9ZZZZ
MVFHIIEPICLNNSPPAIAGHKLVVSEKGDILSPNKAPEITAPAISPGGNPILMPIPIMARPAEPAEP